MSTLIFSSGCASSGKPPVALNLESVKEQSRDDHAFVPLVTQLTDKRQNKKIIKGARHLKDPEENPVEWIKSSLQQRGYLFSEDAIEGDKKTCRIALDVNFISTKAVATTKTATVVLSLSQDKSPQPKVIRGQNTSVLWTKREGEISNALEKALGDGIDKLDEVLSDTCT